ncbi:purine-nucleoside phosphorylase [Chitinispirillales bacterium ANBcel5]|uniref:purine-nucleoside phosphorylase n=1 Tax=Cellulosispirillum alkaliphilum TaxID=3039283 RepID=UPI002A5499A8|nr:purine-nucleoside phosphorylase [Chitinispirillales bacterium ANBcel5]
MTSTYDMIQEAREFLESKTSVKPEIGIILGTGLGRLAESIDKEAEIPYETIPHFPVSTVEAHAGKLIFGKLAGKSVMAMQGRFHYYEGYSMQQIVFPVRVMKFMNVSKLIVSNACGGVNPLFKPGTIMAITDHINLLADNPLIGANDNRIGVRFPDMSQPYSNRLIELVSKIALENNIRIEKGVYSAMSGPSLETRAEYRMLRILGADVIGMSTVPEVIAAVHAGLEVLGLSVVTDSCLPDALEPVDLKKIIAVADKTEPLLVKLIEKVLEAL